MKRLQLFLALILAALLSGCAQPAPSESKSSAPAKVDLAEAEAAVRAADAQWLAAAKSRDTEKTVAFWADDASIMMPGAPPVTGKKAIKDYVAGAFASPEFSISWTTDKVVVSDSGDMAYSTGEDQITFKGPGNKVVTQKNNGVAIWKKQADGSWKVAIDIATAEPEATSQKAAGNK
ncbi:MAG: hypothetical protein JWN45_2463 [Acidobacteriaceae bacterium]|nr:hypothetical protein [Acidobacteriaceae bacterium]